MSNILEQASLVLIPSGYKSGKLYSQIPTSGDGDLQFTRASNATRVNSAGLIEKVRTNLALYSEQFDNAFWVKTNTTVVANSGIAPNGTTTAELVYPTTTGSNRLLEKSFSISASTPYTGTWHLKASGLSWVAVDHVDGNVGAWFNLSTGTIGTISAGSTASIENLGNGWYRCRVSKTSGGGTTGYHDIRLVDGDNVTTVTANGTDGLLVWGAQLETGDIATDYIPTTTAAVSVGMTADVPRLDYLGSSCPSLLLEPQRTNNLVYSEQFNNAAWATDGNGAGETKTANYAISPDGYQDADRIQLNRTGGSYSRVRQDYVAAGTHTGSIYLKSNTGSSQKIWIRIDGTVSTKITITTSWQRFVVSGSTSAAIELFIDNTDAEIATIADFLAWGAQLEAGSYATSYIPTLGTSVTRVADAASKTGISSLIGQTEGTLFLEVDFTNISGVQVLLSVHDGALNKRFEIWADSAVLYGFIGGSVNITIGNTTITNGSHKIALAYKQSGDQAFYVDGVQIGISATPYTIAALTSLSYAQYTGLLNPNEGVKQTILFKTRLSNTELAQLTTL